MFVVHGQLQNCWSTVPVSALGDLKAKTCHHDKRPVLAPRHFCSKISSTMDSCDSAATAVVSAPQKFYLPPFLDWSEGPAVWDTAVCTTSGHTSTSHRNVTWSNIVPLVATNQLHGSTTNIDPRQLPLKLDFSSVQWLVCCKPLGSIHCRAQPWHRPFRGILNQSQQKKLWNLKVSKGFFDVFCPNVAKQHIYAQSLPAALHAHICRTRTAGTVCHAKWVLLTGTWRLRVWAS